MAFLDNSGDIILDAVLTDTGRFRLAKGDGSFRIVKYAFGDDEINYSLYKNTNHANGAHASGSAYYDLDILQTPVLEAFTNNTSLMKSKLISIPRNNLTHLPVIKVNDKMTGREFHEDIANTYLVAVDSTTQDYFNNDTKKGVLSGADNTFAAAIRLDQGLDTADISEVQLLDSDLNETQYIIEMDHRLGTITNVQGVAQKVSFIDDDFVASYYFSAGTDSSIVKPNTAAGKSSSGTADQTIAGPKGTVIEFSMATSANLRTSDYLFDKIGGGTTDTTEVTVDADEGKDGSAGNCDGASTAGKCLFKHIDTIIRVSGATTGYSIDIPVRFIRYNSALNSA